MDSNFMKKELTPIKPVFSNLLPIRESLSMKPLSPLLAHQRYKVSSQNTTISAEMKPLPPVRRKGAQTQETHLQTSALDVHTGPDRGAPQNKDNGFTGAATNPESKTTSQKVYKEAPTQNNKRPEKEETFNGPSGLSGWSAQGKITDILINQKVAKVEKEKGSWRSGSGSSTQIRPLLQTDKDSQGIQSQNQGKDKQTGKALKKKSKSGSEQEKKEEDLQRSGIVHIRQSLYGNNNRFVYLEPEQEKSGIREGSKRFLKKEATERKNLLQTDLEPEKLQIRSQSPLDKNGVSFECQEPEPPKKYLKKKATKENMKKDLFEAGLESTKLSPLRDLPLKTSSRVSHSMILHSDTESLRGGQQDEHGEFNSSAAEPELCLTAELTTPEREPLESFQYQFQDEDLGISTGLHFEDLKCAMPEVDIISNNEILEEKLQSPQDDDMLEKNESYSAATEYRHSKLEEVTKKRVHRENPAPAKHCHNLSPPQSELSVSNRVGTSNTLKRLEEEEERQLLAESLGRQRSLVAKIREEEARLKKESQRKLKQLQESLKAEQERQETLRAEHAERLETLRQSLLAKTREEEERLKSDSDQKLEELRQTLQTEQKTKEEKIRKEIDEDLEDLKTKLQEQQEKNIKKLKARNKQKLEQLQVEFEEELEEQKEQLQKNRKLKSPRQNMEERRDWTRARCDLCMYQYHKEITDQEQKRKIEQLRLDHQKEIGEINENHLNEKEELLSSFTNEKKKLEMSYEMDLKKLNIEHQTEILKRQREIFAKESEQRKFTDELKLKYIEIKTQEAMLQARVEDLHKRRRVLEAEEKERDRKVKSMSRVIQERDLLKEELDREREEKHELYEKMKMRTPSNSELRADCDRAVVELRRSTEELTKTREQRNQLAALVNVLQERYGQPVDQILQT